MLFSFNKKENPAICDNVAIPWEYYAKWNKLITEGQILHDTLCMWNLKESTSKKKKKEATP